MAQYSGGVLKPIWKHLSMKVLIVQAFHPKTCSAWSMSCASTRWN